jgi:transcription elongation GreA/GreB family factor
LARDAEALDRRISAIADDLRSHRSGLADTYSQSSETWHDNPMFDEGQRRFEMLATSLEELSQIRMYSQIVQPATDPEAVDVGVWVTVEDDEGYRDRFFIAGAMVLDAPSDYMSYASPLGKLLLGARPGETRIGEVGGRSRSYLVVAVAPDTSDGP